MSVVREDFMPVTVVAAVPFYDEMKFLCADGQIEIDAQDATEVWQVLEHCNGYNNVPMIAKLTGMKTKDITDILETLVELGLVMDVREQYMHFHKISNNIVLDCRKVKTDTRWEKLKKGLKANQALGVCRSLYHEAGLSSRLSALLRIYLLVEEVQEGFSSGYYEYCADEDALVWYNEVDELQLRYCFDQADMPYGTTVQMVLALDFEQEERYDNRDYRMALIEIGQKVEWLKEHLERRSLKLYEYENYQDGPLTVEMGMCDKCWPVMVLAVAAEAILPRRDQTDMMSYVKENVGKEKPVKGCWINYFGDTNSCVGATILYQNACGMNQYAGATGSTTAEAVYKAVIEGYERWTSGQVRVDYHGKAKYLKSRYLDTYSFIPLTPAQIKRSGLVEFNDDLSIDWTVGRNCNNEGIFVPSDLVYYGYKPHENCIYHGHSSGIAAYTDLSGAKLRAMVELIERDALMRNWFMRKSPRIISEEILPLHVQRRMSFWEEQDRKMFVLELDSDYGWVYEVIIISEEYPCFVSGAAATIERVAIPETIIKAMEEAEYNLLLAIKYPYEQEINPKTVRTPIMHGMVYYCKENAESLYWLWNGEVVSEFRDGVEYGVRELNTMLQLVTVDLSVPGSDLKVVRVLSPKLVPISFGFNMAHYTHPEISGELDPASLEMPHYFA